MNSWCYRLSKDIKTILVFCKFLNVFDVCVIELWLFLFIKETCNTCCNDLGPKNSWNYTVNALAGGCAVDACNLNTIAWLEFLN